MKLGRGIVYERTVLKHRLWYHKYSSDGSRALVLDSLLLGEGITNYELNTSAHTRVAVGIYIMYNIMLNSSDTIWSILYLFLWDESHVSKEICIETLNNLTSTARHIQRPCMDVITKEAGSVIAQTQSGYAQRNRTLYLQRNWKCSKRYS